MGERSQHRLFTAVLKLMNKHQQTRPTPLRRPIGARETIIALCLGLFLFAVYLLSYRGGFHSIDEVSMYCVTESLVKRGRFNTDQIVWTEWTTTFSEAQGFFGADGHVYSKKGLAISLFAAPLYLLALNVPGLGLLQTTFLLNAMVTALTGSVIFLCVRRLGYRSRVSGVTALVFGLGTIAWVYSKYFFSEPLSALLLLLAFYFSLAASGEQRAASRVPPEQQQCWPLFLLMGAGLASGLAVVTRANNALALPILFVYLLATFPRSLSPAIRRLLLPAICYLLSLAAPGLLFGLYNAVRSGSMLQTGYDLTVFDLSYFWKGSFKFLISPYRGLLVYSPILLLSFVTFPRFFRKHRAEAWVCATIPLAYFLLFAFWVSGEGLSWGPRFLVPTLPFLIIPLAPLIDDMHRSPARWTKATFSLLLLISVIIQVLGVSVNPQIHMMRLLETFPALDRVEKLEGTPALYHPRYSPLLGQIRSLSLVNSDLAWWQPWGLDWAVTLVTVALILLCGAVLIHLFRRAGTASHPYTAGKWVAKGAKVEAALVVICLAAALAVSGFSLRRYYRTDLQFGPLDNGYSRILAYIDERGRPDDGIVTVAPYHYHVPMNRYKGRLPIYGFAQDEPPLEPFAEPLLERILAEHPRLWFITSGLQPADPTNGVERWWVKHAFKAGDEWYDDFRLCPFSSPQGEAKRIPLSANLGGEVALVGYSLENPKVEPGDVIRLPFYWQALTEMERDYTVFVHLLDAKGEVQAQRDSQPVGGYCPTSTWREGEEVKDNYGLSLPPDLPAGEYVIVMGMYEGATGTRLPVLDETGQAMGDHVMLNRVLVDKTPP